MRKIVLFLGIAVLLLALSGAAEAAIASTGGGLSSSLSGSGISQATGGLSAGHSAIVSRHAHVELTGTGTASQTDAGNNAAIDPVNGASVFVSGTTTASIVITGSVHSLLTSGIADALIQASSEQDGDYETVQSYIASTLDLSAADGDTVKGLAVASGQASAGGIPAISSSVSGHAESFGKIKGYDTVANHLAAGSYIQSGAMVFRLMGDNVFGASFALISSTADIGNYWNEGGLPVITGPGPGSASVSAQGTAMGVSTWVSGKDTTTVSGSASGTYSSMVKDETNGGFIRGSSTLFSSSADLENTAYITGITEIDNSDSASGSVSASGTVHDLDSDEQYPHDKYITGSVGGTVTQSGAGYSFGEGYILALPVSSLNVDSPYGSYPVGYHYNEFPTGADEEGITIQGISSGEVWGYGVTSSLGTWAFAEGEDETFQAISNFHTTGTAFVTRPPGKWWTYYGTYYDDTASATGTSQTGISASKQGSINADSSITATAGFDPWQGIWGGSGPTSAPYRILSFSADALTLSRLESLIKSEGSSSFTATTSATGNAGASAVSHDVADTAGYTTDVVSSATSASGSVGGKVKGGSAAVGSMILGFSIAGDEIDNEDSFGSLSDCGLTDTTVLTSAAVSNPGSGTFTAGGTAKGEAKSSASETNINQGTDESGKELSDTFSISSGSTGMMSADVSAKYGYGISLAYARSGNIAGQSSGFTGGLSAVSGTGDFLLRSTDPETFYTGIHTGSQGTGLGFALGPGTGGLVSGSATATNVVTDDSGSYVRKSYNPANGVTATVFSMSTKNHLSDPAKSEFKTRDVYSAGASTDAWAFSQAEYDLGAELGPTGYADAWGGYSVSAEGTDDAPGTTAKATVKPVDLSASASTTKKVSASVMMKGGDGLASVKTQYPATGDVHAFYTVISPATTGKYRTVEWECDTDIDTDPNFAAGKLSLAASSWNIHPDPF